MTINVDNPTQMALQTRLRRALDDLARQDSELKAMVEGSPDRSPRGQPTLDLPVFAQAIADIQRAAQAVSQSANAVLTELAERGLIQFR